MTWQLSAACRGLNPDLFFPEGDTPPSTAIAVCQACPVRTQCLEAALDEEAPQPFRNVHGIRGGLTAAQRRRILAASFRTRSGPPRLHDDACGTHRGYKRHLRRDEPTCAPCRAAHTRYVLDARRRRHLKAVG